MPSPNHRKRLLLVDDEASILAALGLLLESADFDVQMASSGEQALAALEKDRFDLLITDNRMPGMSGTDLAVTVKQRCPGLPIFMFTGYPPSQTLHCFDLVLLKPNGLSHLLPSVKRILEPPSVPSITAFTE